MVVKNQAGDYETNVYSLPPKVSKNETYMSDAVSSILTTFERSMKKKKEIPRHTGGIWDCDDLMDTTESDTNKSPFNSSSIQIQRNGEVISEEPSGACYGFSKVPKKLSTLENPLQYNPAQTEKLRKKNSDEFSMERSKRYKASLSVDSNKILQPSTVNLHKNPAVYPGFVKESLSYCDARLEEEINSDSQLSKAMDVIMAYGISDNTEMVVHHNSRSETDKVLDSNLVCRKVENKTQGISPQQCDVMSNLDVKSPVNENVTDSEKSYQQEIDILKRVSSIFESIGAVPKNSLGNEVSYKSEIESLQRICGILRNLEASNQFCPPELKSEVLTEKMNGNATSITVPDTLHRNTLVDSRLMSKLEHPELLPNASFPSVKVLATNNLKLAELGREKRPCLDLEALRKTKSDVSSMNISVEMLRKADNSVLDKKSPPEKVSNVTLSEKVNTSTQPIAAVNNIKVTDTTSQLNAKDISPLVTNCTGDNRCVLTNKVISPGIHDGDILSSKPTLPWRMKDRTPQCRVNDTTLSWRVKDSNDTVPSLRLKDGLQSWRADVISARGVKYADRFSKRLGVNKLSEKSEDFPSRIPDGHKKGSQSPPQNVLFRNDKYVTSKGKAIRCHKANDFNISSPTKYHNDLDAMISLKVFGRNGVLVDELMIPNEELTRVMNKFPKLIEMIPSPKAEQDEVLELSANAVMVFLRCVFSSSYTLPNWEIALETFAIAKKYQVEKLQESCLAYFNFQPINSEQVQIIVNLAKQYQITEVLQTSSIFAKVPVTLLENPEIQQPYKVPVCSVSCTIIKEPTDFSIPLEYVKQSGLGSTRQSDIQNYVDFEALSGTFCITGIQIKLEAESFDMGKELHIFCDVFKNQEKVFEEERDKPLNLLMIINFKQKLFVKPKEKVKISVLIEDVCHRLCHCLSKDKVQKKCSLGSFLVAFTSDKRAENKQSFFFIEKLFYTFESERN